MQFIDKIMAMLTMYSKTYVNIYVHTNVYVCASVLYVHGTLRN